jgi:hypothetical protein
MWRAHWRHATSLLLGLCLITAACGGASSTASGGSSAGGTATLAPATSAPVQGCPIFPADNIWNRDISQLPVDPHSDQYIATIGAQGSLHPDFGTDPSYGIPYNVVQGTPKPVAVGFDYAGESDPGPYPIPANPIIEDGGDAHILIMDEQGCHLYELYDAQRNADGSWHAGSGAIWDLRSNTLRPASWTSADAAGLPIFPGLVRYDEVAAGAINHALRFTAKNTRNTFVWPARHEASDSNDPNYPPMGLRLRLKASYSLAGFSGESLVILEALKRYGLIVADNGSPWFITGAPSASWSDENLEQLKRVPGSEFEAVESGPIIHG